MLVYKQPIYKGITLPAVALLLVLLLSFFFYTAKADGPVPPNESVILSRAGDQQHGRNWCWAASTETILRHLSNQTVMQCVQASSVFFPRQPSSHCCLGALDKPADENNCDKPSWPVFEPFGFSAVPHNGPLSFDEIVQEIKVNKRPFSFTWTWLEDGRPVGAHMMVGIGYEIVNGQKLVASIDPLSGDEQSIPYQTYVSVSGKYNHSRDYYQIVQLPAHP